MIAEKALIYENRGMLLVTIMLLHFFYILDQYHLV